MGLAQQVYKKLIISVIIILCLFNLLLVILDNREKERYNELYDELELINMDRLQQRDELEVYINMLEKAETENNELKSQLETYRNQ